MAKRVHYHSNLIFSVGTQVVTSRDIVGQSGRTLHPRGSVGVVVRSPRDLDHSYRVRFPDGVEEALKPSELTLLAKYKEGEIGDSEITAGRSNLFERVIYRCVIGSRAYGLEDDQSDTDYRGFYLPPAELQWSLYGVPEQLECEPDARGVLGNPEVSNSGAQGEPERIGVSLTRRSSKRRRRWPTNCSEMRSMFLSRLVYQTYNGYVMSQFKKMQADIRNQGQVKWKHVMHLIRLLISGISVLREGFVPVRVDDHREDLLTIKRGEMPWEETEKWRLSLHAEFDKALGETKLPERPNYEKANDFLIKARRAAVLEG